MVLELPEAFQSTDTHELKSSTVKSGTAYVSAQVAFRYEPAAVLKIESCVIKGFSPGYTIASEMTTFTNFGSSKQDAVIVRIPLSIFSSRPRKARSLLFFVFLSEISPS